MKEIICLILSSAWLAIYGLAQVVYTKRLYSVALSLSLYILPLVALVFLLRNDHNAEDQAAANRCQYALFVFPFVLGVEPIKRLLVISFRGDPEYEMIEPQYYNDTVFGNGLRILIYRRDKKVDVYYHPGVLFERSDFALGKGLGRAVETQISPDRFEITNTGVDIDIAFNDYKGRRVVLFIKENYTSNNSLPFLAPVGKDMENPSKLLLAYMQEFDFVKKKSTTIDARVGDRVLIPSNFVIRRNGQKVYFARYASKLTIGEINPPRVKPIIIKQPNEKVAIGGHNFKMNKQQAVTHYWVMYGSERIELSFNAAFPNLLNLQQNERVKGTWEYAVSGSFLTGGDYILLRKGDIVNIEMAVTQQWKPKNLPFSLSVFTLLVRSFRNWPTTYHWSGNVNLMDMSMNGNWHRK